MIVSMTFGSNDLKIRPGLIFFSSKIALLTIIKCYNAMAMIELFCLNKRFAAIIKISSTFRH